jgi:hypothetical protein
MIQRALWPCNGQNYAVLTLPKLSNDYIHDDRTDRHHILISYCSACILYHRVNGLVQREFLRELNRDACILLPKTHDSHTCRIQGQRVIAVF